MAERKEYWTTEDGQKFDTKEEAIAHEKEIKDPIYFIKNELESLRKRIEKLESENICRKAEIEALKNPFAVNPTQKPWWEKPLSPTFMNNAGNSDEKPKMFYGEGDSVEDALKNLKEVK